MPICPTVLLGDNPTEEDAFRHREIASAIAGMILTEDGGRAIALTGPWGSGKSTVVTLLARELGNSKEPATVITFDAWAHQGDPLRRTFLEVAIEELGQFLDPKKWSERRDILARRLVITNTHAQPQLTGLGALGALALLASPVSFQLFSILTKDDKAGITLPHWVLFGFGASPLLLSLYILLMWLRSYMQRDPRPIPSLIYSASENRTVTNTGRTAEPTSVEFEQAYCDLLREAIGTSNRKVVLVIDNLDRLEATDAKAVWATLRTFFDKPLRSEPWFHKTWILVPFDSEGLKSSQTTNGDSPANPFVEKTFQAFFRVPAPLLSNWEAYLYQQLAIALPGHKGSDEYHDIFRVYDNLKRLPSDTPTPRQLKLFVNKLGSLHRQWQHQIPLATQAAFLLLLEQHGGSFVERLQNTNDKELTTESVSRRLPGDWQRDVAALYFNVPVDMAFEALLNAPVSSALVSRNPSALQSLERSPGFDEILQRAIERIFAQGGEPDQEALLCASVQMGTLDASKPAFRFPRKLLYDQVSRVESWSNVEEFTGEALGSLVCQNETQPIQTFVASLENSIPEGENGTIDSEELAAWLGAIRSFANRLKLAKSNFPFSFKIAAVKYTQVIEAYAAIGSDRSLIESLEPLEGSSVVVSQFVSTARASGWEEADTAVVALLLPFKKTWEWGELAKALISTTGTVEVGVAASPMLAAVDQLLQAKLFQDVMSSAASLNTTVALSNYSTFQDASEARESALMGCLLLLNPLSLEMEQPQRIPSPQYPYNNQFVLAPLTSDAVERNAGRTKLNTVLMNSVEEGDDLIAQISRDYFSAESWRTAAEAEPRKLAFVLRITLQALAAQQKDFFHVEDMLEHIDFWQDNLGEADYVRMLDLIGINDAVSEWLLDRKYESRFDGLYRLALKRSFDPKVNALVTEGLRAYTASDWTATLTDDPEKVGLLLQLIEPDLGVGLEDALFSLAENDLASNSSSNILASPKSLIACLGETARARFQSRLVNEFGRQQGPFDKTLSRWGKALETSLEVEGIEHAEEKLIQTITRANADELAWIAEVLTRVDREAKGKTGNRLKSEVRQQLKQASDETILDNLREFSSRLGWKFRL